MNMIKIYVFRKHSNGNNDQSKVFLVEAKVQFEMFEINHNNDVEEFNLEIKTKVAGFVFAATMEMVITNPTG